MAKTKKKEVQKQGLRPSQKAKAEKLRKKQEAKKAAAALLLINENDTQSAVSASEVESQPSLSATTEKKTRAKVAISLTKDKKIVRRAASTTTKKTTRTTARKSAEEEQPQVKENAVEDLTTITVKNAEGDPDTTAEILIQNKIDYTPKVSVIIPVYNVEPYLRECLDSVINQTLREIEIICVDDGSTDSSLEIFKEYAKKDNRITVITQKNAGSGKARNNGINNANGEFIAFMDSDDMYPSEKTLEHMYKAAIENDVLICGGSLSQLREGGKIVTDPKEFEEGYSFKKEGIVKYSDYQFDYGYWRFIFNRKFLKENQLYFPDYLRQQDPPFFVKTMAVAKTFYALTEPTYVYRVSYKQISWNERKTMDLFKGIGDCLKYSKQYGLSRLHSQIAQRLNIWTFRTAAATMIDNKNVRQQILQTLDTVDYDILKKENVSLELDDVYKAIIQAKDNDIIVSIIIPCYNVEKYLARCLESIVNQTFHSMEILCVNDGSPDNSLKIMEEYAKKDSRIRIINKKNGGLSSARNAGVPEAKGFFINFIDSDDWIDVTTIEKAVTKMSGPVDLVCYGAEIVNEGLDQYNRGIYVGKEYHKIKVTGQREMTEDVILKSSYTVWNKLFKTHIIKDFDIKFAEGRLFEDNDYSIIYMMHCRSGYYLDEYLYYYVQRPGSIMERVRARESNKTVDHLYIFKNIYDHAIKYKLDNFSNVLTTRFLLHLRMAYQFAPEECRQWIRETVYDLFSESDEEYITTPTLKLIKQKRFSLIRELNEVIISLTSYPARIGTIHLVIESLLNQSMRADRVILWLAPEQFPNKEADLPQELLDLQAKGLTIGWYKDIRSYKKLIPTLQLYPNSIIVTADDDNIYQKDWLKKLFDSYVNYPNDIQTHRVTKFYYANDRFYTFAGGRSYYKGASYLNKLVGLGGVLYPPHCFYQDILNEDLIKQLAPTNDDQWFWLQAAINGVKVRVVDNPDIDAHYVEGTQETGLTNVNDHGENLFWKDFNRLIEYYPEFKRLLIQENEIVNSKKGYIPYKDDMVSWCKSVFNNQHYDIDNPKTFTEKMQWLKLYASTPIKTLLADKYLVRDWIKEKIGEEYLIPLLGVYDSFEEIDFDKLPNQFVIKCNHGCGYNIIVKNKEELDLNDVKYKLDQWMNENFAFKSGFELQYRDIKPKITIEKFIENKKAGDLYDYKFYCFNGTPTYVQFISDRKGYDIKQSFYNMDWQKQSFYNNNQYDPRIKPCPISFQKMKDLAAILSKGFPFVRVDFYQLDNGDIYFGEMTFSPATGAMKWNTEDVNLKLGKMIKLPSKAYDMNTGKYYKIKKTSILNTYLMLPYYLYKIRKMDALKEEKINNLILSQLSGIRINIKNFGNAKNSMEIEGNNLTVLTPHWFSDEQGIGKTIETSALSSTIKFKIVNSGKLKIDFRGQDRRYEGKRFPVWIDYKSIKIDGREILSKPVSVWHDEPYHYEMSVKDGQEITMDIEQKYHEYTEKELENILLKLNPDNKYVNDNINTIISEIKSKLPIIDEETRRKRELEKCLSDILSNLTAYRLDIKNFGSEKNDIEIEASAVKVEIPQWFTNNEGIGKVLQGNTLNNKIKLKVVNDGKLKIDFKGQDRRYEGKRFPLWIDYKSIKIDGNEILSKPMSLWHDEPYRYEMSVKDGQEITMDIEQKYHGYTEGELKDIILKLNLGNKYVNDNINTIMSEIKSKFPIIDEEMKRKVKSEHKFLEVIDVLKTYRLDIKNFGSESNSVEIVAKDGKIEDPKWFSDAQGVGKVIQGNSNSNTLRIKAINDGKLMISFKGPNKEFNGERFPVWIDYISIKINGKEFLAEPVATWHNSTYRYEMPVRDGQEVTVEFVQQHHGYTKDEIKQVLLKLVPNYSDITEHLDLFSAFLKQSNNNEKQRAITLPKIIATTGLFYTGSSAVIGFLNEFDNTTVMGYCEAQYSAQRKRKNCGEVEFFSVTNFCRFTDVFYKDNLSEKDSTIKKFIHDIYSCYDNKGTKPHEDNYEFYSDEFLQNSQQLLCNVLDLDAYTIEYLREHRFPLKYSPDVHKNCSFIRGKGGSQYLFYQFKNISAQEFENCISIYVHQLFSSIHSKQYLVCDQLLRGTYAKYTLLEKLNSYLTDNPIKEICVYRDPRDRFLSAFRMDITHLQRTPEEYEQDYRKRLDCRILKHNPNRLMVRFEDMVLKYDETTKKIMDFIGVDPVHHVAPKSMFDPAISVVNIGAYKQFIDQDFMKQVEERMPEYCYYPEKENLSEDAWDLLRRNQNEGAEEKIQKVNKDKVA